MALKTLCMVPILTAAFCASAAEVKCAMAAPAYGALMVLLYAGVGALALFACFKLFDLAITKIEIEKEIRENNVSVAVFAGAVVIGISLIVAAAIAG